MSRSGEAFIECLGRRLASGGSDDAIDPYDLYVAESALARIAAGERDPQQIARRALVAIGERSTVNHVGVDTHLAPRYSQMTRLERLLSKAKKNNDELDAIDREMGASTPRDWPLDIQIATASAAIECGITTEDWDCVAEGVVMLREILSLIPRTKA